MDLNSFITISELPAAACFARTAHASSDYPLLLVKRFDRVSLRKLNFRSLYCTRTSTLLGQDYENKGTRKFLWDLYPWFFGPHVFNPGIWSTQVFGGVESTRKQLARSHIKQTLPSPLSLIRLPRNQNSQGTPHPLSRITTRATCVSSPSSLLSSSQS